MYLFHFIRQRSWAPVLGYVLFINMLAAGYYYNLTFVQLGLVDLGTRVLGMTESSVAANMAVLAGLTCVVAIVTGLTMGRLGWSTRFDVKLKLAFAVIALQTILTGAALLVSSERGFLLWVVAASVALGVGIPVTFGMTTDLIPVRDRGYVAAFITAGAYFPAAVLSTTWQIDRFAIGLLPLMAGATIVFGVLAFRRFTFVDELGQQHRSPHFGAGRFTRQNGRFARPGVGFGLALALMFGIFFIDSLGFLRLIETPVYMGSAWHATDALPVLLIGIAHVVVALIAGVLYSALSPRALFLWVFGLFALAQLMYLEHARTTPDSEAVLSMALVYSAAVSIYTVLNFALWADFSTPATIARNTALGVAVSGWLATFLSTGLSIQWQTDGVPFAEHIANVAAIALLLLVVVLMLILFSGQRRKGAAG
jgi:MFS family permease